MPAAQIIIKRKRFIHSILARSLIRSRIKSRVHDRIRRVRGNSGGDILAYTQTDRPLKITTPLGPDILLLTGIKGHEEISHLFKFKMTLIADLTKDIHF